MHRRKLEELNLLDDFLFNKMVSHPEFGEEFARELLRIILGKEVGNLKSGQDYHTLKNVVVIFIMPKDPLGANRMFYTIESKCKELPDLPYDDGAKTIFLYTKGMEGNPKEELKDLLAYMENSCEDNVKNDALKKIHQMMKRVKSDEEVSLEYMKIYEREQMIKEQGHKEGREEGREEGRQEEAKENARKLFENGVSYKVVRSSIQTLSDQELKKIYDKIKK